MARLHLWALLGLVLAAAAAAQAQDSAACDPTSASTALIDLTDSIGKLGCRVPPSVDLVDVMRKLTSTLNNLSADQLKQLPPLLEIMLAADPAALAPFFELSGDELERLVPLLTEVPVETLKAAFELLAKQEPATVDRMIRFLKGVSRAKLEQLSPLFSRMTQGQVNILLHALNVLPEHAWDLLIHIMQRTGPLTDTAVAVTDSAKQHLGLGGSGGSGNATKVVSLRLFGGRRLLQEAEGACDPSTKGLTIGVDLMDQFGAVVCKYGPETLKPVLQATLDLLNAQPPEKLAALPGLTDALTRADPKAFQVFFKIPTATLKSLVPVLGSADPKAVTRQLKLLASQDAETLGKMVLFLKATPASQMELLIGMFAKLSDKQVDILVKFMNALSPGQIKLAIALLDKFGYSIDAIGRAIPEKRASAGRSYNIGPLHINVVDMGGSGSGSGNATSFSLPKLPKHPLFKFP